MAAALLVPMQRASEQWESDAAEFIKICRAAAGRCCDRLLGSAKAAGTTAAVPETSIVPQLDKLHTSFTSARFEAPFDREAHRRREAFTDRAWQLARAAISIDSVSAIELSASALSQFRDDLANLRATAAAEDPERPGADPFDSFRAKLDNARRDGRLLAGDYLVLDAVAQFSNDITAIARDAQRDVKSDKRLG
jgi:hypothetical protein